MAITENRRMQQLRGKYADLDKTKMLVGEIAVPSDHSPIMKVDTDKYIELVSSEDTEYIEKITAEIEQTLDDVNQLAIDKVGINDNSESSVQTYSSRKIEEMHNAQSQEIENVRNEQEQAIANMFKIASGTSIVATDSSKGYATDFSCVGNVEQKQYSGKNLLNNTATTQTIGGITFTVNADGSITANGTNTGNVELYLIPTSNEEILPAGDYILSGCPSGGSTSTYVLDGRITNYYADKGSGKSFTLTEETAIGYIRILIYANANPKNLTFYPMIRKSTADATYEPYTGGTASPNPNYPQAIMNSGDCVEMLENTSYNSTTGAIQTQTNRMRSKHPVPCKNGDVVTINSKNSTICAVLYYKGASFVGANYLAMTNTISFTMPNGVDRFEFVLGNDTDFTPSTAGKIELTINDKYVLQVKSCNKNLADVTSTEPLVLVKSTARTGYVYFAKMLKIKEGYTISFKVSGASLGGYKVNCQLYTSTSGVVYASATGNGICQYTFTEDVNIERLYFFIDSNAGDTATATISEIQVEPNSTATDYVPHAESISTLLLDEPPRAVGEVKDVIECVNDGYKVRRRLNARIFNGSESWATSTPTKSGLYRYDVYISDTSRKSYSAMCSHFIMSKATTSFADNVTEVSFAVHPTNGNFCFFVEFETLDEWKTWLASNPITVQYEMAEEVIEDIADQTPFYQIQTYDGGTTISTTDRLQPQIEVEYPTNRVSGVASEGYAKASALSDKILSYQFRDIPGDVLGALFSVELPDGVDGRNCTVITSYCVAPTKYSEMDAGYPWYYGSNFNTYTGNNGFISTISGYIPEATSGYAHVNVTVIRNDI